MRQSLTLVLTALLFAGVGMAIKSGSGDQNRDPHEQGVHEHADAAATAEFERGPHRGRMLRDGEFALEITIFEDGVPPEFHVFPYLAGKPVAPAAVNLAIELSRLGDRTDKISFTAQDDYLKSSQTVVEPHSFDVRVRAERGGKTSEWSYPSYEGRTQVSAKAAEAAGIKIEKAEPASIEDVIDLSGVISLNEDRNARVGGRFPGIIKSVNKTVGQSVRAGEVLAVLDRNVTLQDYTVVSPIDGVVVARAANIGGTVATDTVLFEIADLSTVWAELHLFGRDRERVKVGQSVLVESYDKLTRAKGTVAYVTPVAEAASQALVIRVVLDNDGSKWFPGSFVFAQVGNVYEVRMLDLGTSDGTRTEVLGGIEPGETYVTENSFLIKADIEKSGAGHDH
jgi:cobalt-zinc-cadmium efflux system membrane fusion protein